MKARAFLLLAVMACAAMAQAPKKTRPIALSVPGAELSVTATSLPFRIVAPDEPAYFLFAYPPGWEVERKNNNVLIVNKAPDGTHTVTLRTLPYDPSKGQKQGEGRIVVIVAAGAAAAPLRMATPAATPAVSLPPAEEAPPEEKK